MTIFVINLIMLTKYTQKLYQIGMNQILKGIILKSQQKLYAIKKLLQMLLESAVKI